MSSKKLIGREVRNSGVDGELFSGAGAESAGIIHPAPRAEGGPCPIVEKPESPSGVIPGLIRRTSGMSLCQIGFTADRMEARDRQGGSDRGISMTPSAGNQMPDVVDL